MAEKRERWQQCPIDPRRIEPEGRCTPGDTPIAVVSEPRGRTDGREVALARAQLIAASPAMLDMLLELEWSGTDTYDGLDFDACPYCEGGRPNHRRTPPMYAGHFDDCRLDQLITQAGGRSS